MSAVPFPKSTAKRVIDAKAESLVSLGTAALEAGDRAARERLEGLDSVDMNKPHIRFSYASLPPLPESTRRRLVALASPPPTRLQSCLTALGSPLAWCRKRLSR